MKTVAVIEDNPDNRLLVRAILRDRYEVVEYERAADALVAFAKRRPDVALLDISLPGMDGKEMLARMRADECIGRVPTIALTAHAMEGDRDALLAAGFDGYVAKPIVDENELFDAIERCLHPPEASS
jgi:CheY-like chemotaxis protein